MKKIYVLCLAFATIFSCGDEVEFNSPALQGKKDGNRWKAVSYNASFNESGQLKITGGDNFETITLNVSALAIGDYQLGTNSASNAEFIDFQNVSYSTYNSPDPEFSAYPADGLISITRYNTSNNTVSGEFYFNAYSEDGLKTVNFSEGVFFDLPLPTGSTPDVLSCDDALAEVEAAQTVFSNTATTDPDYSANCNAYRQALINQQNACVDADGSIQEIIDSLYCNDDDDDSILSVNEDINNDGILDNDNTDADEFPNYLDEDDDGDSLLTINEDINADGNLFNDDTDGDSIPNYLDNDDDGDGILTIDEDSNGDGDVTNDDTDADGIPDYLDNM